MQTPGQDQSRSHKVEVTIIVKAYPQVGDKHGETVCVAALDDQRNWYRLYPVPFRQLDADQKFGRWDRISANCRLVPPNRDRRKESRNVDQGSLTVLGKVPTNRRVELIEKAVVGSTKREYAEGRSLALIRPENARFFYRERSPEVIAERLAAYARLARQPDIWGTKPLKALTPAPFEFGYRYQDDDGSHECLCHDWEVEQTYINWERMYGRQRTLDDMMRVYGEDYPREGMVFAMGTHSSYPKNWMIIGVVKMRPNLQPSLF